MIHLAEMALVLGFVLIPVIKHLRLKVSLEVNGVIQEMPTEKEDG